MRKATAAYSCRGFIINRPHKAFCGTVTGKHEKEKTA